MLRRFVVAAFSAVLLAAPLAATAAADPCIKPIWCQ